MQAEKADFYRHSLVTLGSDFCTSKVMPQNEGLVLKCSGRKCGQKHHGNPIGSNINLLGE